MRDKATALVERCLRGEQRAWDALIDQFGRLVYSIPRRYGMDEADCDEVFQGVFLNLYRSLDRLRETERLSSWLITAAHRESWRVGKKRNKYPTLDEQFTDLGEPEPDKAEEWERQQAVRDSLTELGGRCEQLLSALFLNEGEESYEDLAERLGMRVGSIGPTRARCLQKMEAILRERGFDEHTLEA